MRTNLVLVALVTWNVIFRPVYVCLLHVVCTSSPVLTFYCPNEKLENDTSIKVDDMLHRIDISILQHC